MALTWEITKFTREADSLYCHFTISENDQPMLITQVAVSADDTEEQIEAKIQAIVQEEEERRKQAIPERFSRMVGRKGQGRGRTADRPGSNS